MPYAWFSHRSRYILIDDRTGRIVARRAIGWYPVVNGRKPAFLASPAAYRSKRYRVFSRVKRRSAAARTTWATFSAPFATVPPGALKGECVLIVSDYGDPLFQNNYDAFSDWSRSLKIPTFFATGDGLRQTIPGPDAKPPGRGTLRDNTTEMIVKHDCTDILVYITGHGVDPDDGPAAVVTRNKVKETEDGIEQDYSEITADNVSTMIALHPGTGFKVKIDSCFSGRFEDALTEPDGSGGRRSQFKNLLIVETSSPRNQVSSGPNPQLDGDDNPDSLGEFTNQNLKGLKEFFSSSEEITRARAEGGSLMAHALDRAFDLGASVNHGVDPEGRKIVPQKFTNFGPPAPKLKPIHAVFNPMTFTTIYTENATGEALSYTWSVKIPRDLPCARGFKGSSPQPNQATWAHADVSQKGPCNHTGRQIGPRGHPGTVTVVVKNEDWICTATYVGTEGDGGRPVGDGDPPTCDRR